MDWTGNQKSIYVTLGASSHTDRERQKDDYYATEPKAVDLLLGNEEFNHLIWECACGEGHMSKVLEAAGHKVISTDLVYRGFGEKDPLDFLKSDITDFQGDIITNPPYKYALEFAVKALETVRKGGKVALFLKLLFLEGKKRKEFFKKYPPKRIYVSSSRITCAKNGDFEKYDDGGAIAYAWYIWQKGYKGDTVIKWIN